MPRDVKIPDLITDVSEYEISEFWNFKNWCEKKEEIYELLWFNRSINKASVEFIISQNNNKPFQDFTTHVSEKFWNRVFSWKKLATWYALQDFSELHFTFKNYRECEDYLQYFESLWKTLEVTLERVPEQEIRILEYVYSLFKFWKVGKNNSLHSERFFWFLLTLLDKYKVSDPQYILVENIISAQLLQLRKDQALTLKNILAQKKRLASDLGQLLLRRFRHLLSQPHQGKDIIISWVGNIIKNPEKFADMAMNQVSIFQKQQGNIWVEMELLLPWKTQRRQQDNRITQVCNASLGWEIELWVDIMEDVAEFRTGNGWVEMTESNMYSLLELWRFLNSDADIIWFYSHHIHVDRMPGLKTYSSVIPFCGNKQGGASFETKHLPVAIPRYRRISTDNPSWDTMILNHSDARYHCFIEMTRHYDQMLLVNGLKDCQWKGIIDYWEEEWIPSYLTEQEDMSIIFESWRQETQQDLLMKIFMSVAEIHDKTELYYPILRLWKAKLLPNLEFWFKKAIWELCTSADLTGKHIGVPDYHVLWDTRFIWMSIDDGKALREYMQSPSRESIWDKQCLLAGIRDGSLKRYEIIVFLNQMKPWKEEFNYDEVKDIILNPDIYRGIRNIFISFLPDHSIPIAKVQEYFSHPFASDHNYYLVHSLFSKVRYSLSELLPILQKTYKYKIWDELFNMVSWSEGSYAFEDIESMVLDPEIYPELLPPLLAQSDITAHKLFEIMLWEGVNQVVKEGFIHYFISTEFSHIRDFEQLQNALGDITGQKNIWNLLSVEKYRVPLLPFFRHFIYDLTRKFVCDPEVFWDNTYMFFAINELFTTPCTGKVSIQSHFDIAKDTQKAYRLMQEKDFFLLILLYSWFFSEDEKVKKLKELKLQFDFSFVENILSDTSTWWELRKTVARGVVWLDIHTFATWYKKYTWENEIAKALCECIEKVPINVWKTFFLDSDIDIDMRTHFIHHCVERNISYRQMEGILLDPNIEYLVKYHLFSHISQDTRFETIIPFIRVVEKYIEESGDSDDDVFNTFCYSAQADLDLSVTGEFMTEEYSEKKQVAFIGWVAVYATKFDLNDERFYSLLASKVDYLAFKAIIENIAENSEYSISDLERILIYISSSDEAIEDLDECGEVQKMISNNNSRDIEEYLPLIWNKNINIDIRDMICRCMVLRSYDDVKRIYTSLSFVSDAEEHIFLWQSLVKNSRFSPQEERKIFEDESISRWLKIFIVDEHHQNIFASPVYWNTDDDFKWDMYWEISWDTVCDAVFQWNEPLSSLVFSWVDMNEWWMKFFRKINFFWADLELIWEIILDPVYPLEAKRYIWTTVSQKSWVTGYSKQEKQKKLISWLEIISDDEIAMWIRWKVPDHLIELLDIDSLAETTILSLLKNESISKIIRLFILAKIYEWDNIRLMHILDWDSDIQALSQ